MEELEGPHIWRGDHLPRHCNSHNSSPPRMECGTVRRRDQRLSGAPAPTASSHHPLRDVGHLCHGPRRAGRIPPDGLEEPRTSSQSMAWVRNARIDPFPQPISLQSAGVETAVVEYSLAGAYQRTLRRAPSPAAAAAAARRV